MSKIIRIQKPSVLPIYGAGLAFVLLCAVLPVYRLWALAAALAGTAVVFVAAKRVCPPRILEKQVPFIPETGTWIRCWRRSRRTWTACIY